MYLNIHEINLFTQSSCNFCENIEPHRIPPVFNSAEISCIYSSQFCKLFCFYFLFFAYFANTFSNSNPVDMMCAYGYSVNMKYSEEYGFGPNNSNHGNFIIAVIFVK